MMILQHKTKILVGLALILLTATILTVNYTDACRLETVVVNEVPLKQWQQDFPMLQRTSIARQPFRHLAEAVLAEKDVFRVDLTCFWPHTVKISTNAFSPVCFLLDKKTRVLKGVTSDGRIVPLEHCFTDWERPVLTGVIAGQPYRRCRDYRVASIAAQLDNLGRSNPGLFQLLEEINLGREDHVRVDLAGLPFKLLVTADRFGDDLGRFVDFITRYHPDLSDVRKVDARFDNLIICSRETR